MKLVGFPSDAAAKNPPAVQEEDSIPDREDSLEKKMATHSSIICVHAQSVYLYFYRNILFHLD